MDFIKKFFDEFKDIPETGSSMPYSFTEFTPEDSYFTQAEKNYLRLIIAEKINEQDDLRRQVLGTAKYYKEINGVYSKVCFKTHRAIKADIKKLVALQKKIKHTLATRG